MNKKGLVFAFSVFGAVTLGIVGMAGFAASQPLSERFAPVYAYNTLEWEKNIWGECDAESNAFNGKDGIHFIIKDAKGENDNQVNSRNTVGVSLEKDVVYTLDAEIIVVSGTDVKVCSWVTNANNDPFKETTFNVGQEGEVQHFTKEITGIGEKSSQVEIHFGHTAGDYHVILKRVILAEKESGNRVISSYLEDGIEFADRWKEANKNKALCSAAEDDVKYLIYCYCDLTPYHRGLASYVGGNDDEYPDSTVRDSIAYFANRYGITIPPLE